MAEERRDELTREGKNVQPNRKDSWEQTHRKVHQQDETVQASGFYTTIRAQIESQFNTSNQRIFWLILSESFFFNAFVMLVGSQPPPQRIATYNALMWIIPAASLITIAFTYLDVWGSIIYVNKLRKLYDESPINDTEKGYPPINGDKQDRMFARISPYFLPVVFILVWIILLVSKI